MGQPVSTSSFQANARGRGAALSPSGRFAAIANPGGIDRVDLESNERRRLIDGEVDDFVFVRDELVVLRHGLVEFVGGGNNGRTVPVPAGRTLFSSKESVLVSATDGAHWISEQAATFLPLPGRVIGLASPGLVSVSAPGRFALLDSKSNERCAMVTGELEAAQTGPVFDRFAVTWLRGSSRDELWLHSTDGRLMRRIDMPRLVAVAAAAIGGTVLSLGDDNVLRVHCLRSGLRRVIADAPIQAHSVASSSAGSDFLVVGDPGESPFSVLHVSEAQLSEMAEPAPASELSSEPEDRSPVDRASDFPVDREEAEPVTAAELARLFPDSSVATTSADQARALLASEVDVVAKLCALYVVREWESGRAPWSGHRGTLEQALALAMGDGALPNIGNADDAADVRSAVEVSLLQADHRRAALYDQLDGALAPWDELAGRFALGTVERSVVFAVLAPQVCLRTARLFEIACMHGAASHCEGLIADLLRVDPETGLLSAQLDLTDVLDPGASLLAEGILLRGEGPRLTAPLVCADEIVRLIQGVRPVGQLLRPTSASVAVPTSIRSYLAGSATPRLVVTGARARGMELLESIAATAGGEFVMLPGRGETAEFAAQATAAKLRGRLPVLAPQPGSSESAQAAFLVHDGPIVLVDDCADLTRLSDVCVVAADSGSYEQQLEMWRAVTSDCRAGQNRDAFDVLCERFRVSRDMAASLAAQAGGDPHQIRALLCERLSRRLRPLARRVEHLPHARDVVLPDDIRDSLTELVGRRRHHRTVFADWGLDRSVRSGRGIAALFDGPPGTGKTLSAGLVARELERELYVVDASKIASKWIGESEKRLSELFDAAEEADIVLLFDEADSLFAKRSAVTSSNDRYANQTVNYLLQRLDAFTGIAILTTNYGRSIDKAFRRRLTMQVTFPHPDEETRVRLWRAHLPARAPMADDIDLEQLAHRYQLSGGAIRNAVARAAFLAASESSPLCQEHFVRAVTAEFRERGILSKTSSLE